MSEDKYKKALEEIVANGTRCGMHPILQYDDKGEIPCPYCLAEKVLAEGKSEC